MAYKNKEDKKQYNKQYYQKNREHHKQYDKQYYIYHKEYIKQYSKQYRADNKKHRKEWARQYKKQKIRTDLKYNLNRRISCVIRQSLKGNKNGRHWESLVGYTVMDLKKRLQSTMPKNYNWQNYMEGKLHIDHIIAKKYFNFTRPEHIDFKNCWSLSNLQLLPAEENLRKNAKLERPFQPSLKMAYLVEEM